MRSKAHLVPQEPSKTADKWKEKQPKNLCEGGDLVFFLSFLPSFSASFPPHARAPKKKKNVESASLGRISSVLEAAWRKMHPHMKKHKSLMHDLSLLYFM